MGFINIDWRYEMTGMRNTRAIPMSCIHDYNFIVHSEVALTSKSITIDGSSYTHASIPTLAFIQAIASKNNTQLANNSTIKQNIWRQNAC